MFIIAYFKLIILEMYNIQNIYIYTLSAHILFLRSQFTTFYIVYPCKKIVVISVYNNLVLNLQTLEYSEYLPLPLSFLLLICFLLLISNF